MRFEGLAFDVTERVPFAPLPFDSDDAARESFYFAWDMTFGRNGRHRDHRTGGSARRCNGEIFAHAFQGKLAEFAVCQELSRIGISVRPDLRRADLGVWDAGDLQVGELAVAVKSTKQQGNLLLLETADWSPEGTYIHHRGDGHLHSICLVRIDPSPEDLLRKRRILRSDSCPQRVLKWTVAPLSQFRFQVLGAVERNDVMAAVREGQFIPRGATLNGRTKIDADNYYLQACDFRPLRTVRWVP
jgi:hypothetical protein